MRRFVNSFVIDDWFINGLTELPEKKINKMTYEKEFKFSTTVRQYHYSQRLLSPEESQILQCFIERDNSFNSFAMKVYENDKNDVYTIFQKIFQIFS